MIFLHRHMSFNPVSNYIGRFIYVLEVYFDLFFFPLKTTLPCVPMASNLSTSSLCFLNSDFTCLYFHAWLYCLNLENKYDDFGFITL